MVLRITTDNPAAYKESLLSCFFRAFAANPFHRALFPSRLVDPDKPNEEYDFRLTSLENRLGAKGLHVVFAIDDDIEGGKRVLGYAMWLEPGAETSVLPSNSKPAEEEEEGEGDGSIDDGEGGRRGNGKKFPRCLDTGLALKVLKMTEEKRREILGKDDKNVWYLNTLVVDPGFGGKGIARKLSQWGLNKAEEGGYITYLESTPAALGLYMKCGFEQVGNICCIEGVYDVTPMIKKPSVHESNGGV